MGFEGFFTLFLVCSAGAVTPGPSLAVILRHARVGRQPGLAAALGHGFAVLLYALLVVFGLQVVTNLFPSLVLVMRLAGAAWLAWMAWQLWQNAKQHTQEGAQSCEAVAVPRRDGQRFAGALDGFSIAFFNPKIAVFMLAMFSQWLYVGQPFWEKLVMAAIAGVVDGVWYVIVAVILSHGAVARRLSGHIVDRLLSVLLFAIAGYTFTDALQESVS